MNILSKQKFSEQHKFLDKRYEEIKRQGFSDKLICETIGISYISFLRWKARNGLLKRRPHKVTRFTQSEYEHLKEQGFIDADICRVLNCDSRTLLRWKTKHGIKPIHRKYPKTPKKLPFECYQFIENLYPLVESIRVSDVKSLATERLLRSAYIFYCKANEGEALSPEMQRRYFSKVIRFCFVEHQSQKSGVLSQWNL